MLTCSARHCLGPARLCFACPVEFTAGHPLFFRGEEAMVREREGRNRSRRCRNAIVFFLCGGLDFNEVSEEEEEVHTASQ